MRFCSPFVCTAAALGPADPERYTGFSSMPQESVMELVRAWRPIAGSGGSASGTAAKGPVLLLVRRRRIKTKIMMVRRSTAAAATVPAKVPVWKRRRRPDGRKREKEREKLLLFQIIRVVPENHAPSDFLSSHCHLRRMTHQNRQFECSRHRCCSLRSRR